MRFVVYGAGAIGGVVGGRLARGTVTRWCSSRAARTTTRSATTASASTSPDGEPSRCSIPVGRRTRASIDFRDDDVVLLAMKSQDTDERAAARSPARAPASTSVVVRAERRRQRARRAALLRRRLRRVRGVPRAAPRARAWWRRYATPHHRHPRHRSLPARRRRRAPRRSRAAFASSTFESVPRADIMRWKYGKLMNNLGNAVDALCGPRPATARSSTGARGRGRGRASPPPASTSVDREEDAARRGDGFQWGGDGRPVAARARRSWQSLARGTGSIEADYLNGEIVLLGRLHGVAHAGEPAAATARRPGRPRGVAARDAVARRSDPAWSPPDE